MFILFICAMLIILLFCGCGKEKSNNFSAEIAKAWNTSIAENQPEFLNIIDERSSFKCVSTEPQGNGYYVVTVDVSSPDISESIKDYQKEVYGEKISESEMNNKLCELINLAELKITQQTVDVIVDEDKNVRVQFNDDFINAMFGYAYTDAIQTYMDEQIEEK